MLRICLLFCVMTGLATSLIGEEMTGSPSAAGQITGTVSDLNGDTLSGATVVLQGPELKEPRKLISDDNGFFDFRQLGPGSYQISVTAPDFADWTSPELTLTAGQYMILTDCKLRVAAVTTSVNVGYKPEEIA